MKRFAFVNEKNECYTIIVSESKEALSAVPGGELGIELTPEFENLVSLNWVYKDGAWTAPESVVDIEEVTPTPALEG